MVGHSTLERTESISHLMMFVAERLHHIFHHTVYTGIHILISTAYCIYWYI